MKRVLALAILTATAMFALQTTAPSVDGDSSSDGNFVPEPATIGLMAAGLAGVGFAAWRQKKNRP